MLHRKSHIRSFVDKSTPKTYRVTFKAIIFPDAPEHKTFVDVTITGKKQEKYDLLWLTSLQLDYVADTFDVFSFPRRSSVDTIKFTISLGEK